MRLPTRFLCDHLTLTYEGTAHATWEITPPTYTRLARRGAISWHGATTSALMAMPLEIMLSGICQPVPASAVAAAMRAGVTNPGWLEEVADAERRLENTRMYERRVYATAELPRGKQSQVELALGSAVARVGRRFRLPPLPVRAREIDSCLAQADQIEALMSAFLGGRVTPVRNGTLQWLYARAGLRGIAAEPREGQYRDIRPRVTQDREQLMRGPSLTRLRPPHLFEGGTKEDEGRGRRRNYLRADTDQVTCFQTLAVLADIPAEWDVPGGGGEILADLDRVGFPLDWCVRLRPRRNSDAQRDIRGKMRKLGGQYDEYRGDLAGAPPTLQAALDDLAAELVALQDQPGAPEYKATFVFAIGAPDLAELERRADKLRGVLSAGDYSLERPTGDQRALWGAMLPGATCPTAINDYTEYLLPKAVAGCAPFTGSGLGDPRGALLATNLDAHLGGVVLFDPAYGPAMPSTEGGPRSGSFGMCGQLGSGKSQTLKTIIDQVLSRGGQVVVTDRTNMDGVGEYGRMIPVLPPGTRHQTLRVGRDAVAMDPIRMFQGDEADRYATGFLTILTATAPRSARGALIQEGVTYVRERGGRLEDVVIWLETPGNHAEADRPDARELGRLIRHSTKGNAMAQVAFGHGEPVELDADFILFHAPGLALPNEDELKRPDELTPDQVFSIALLYLINCVARHVAFRDRDRYTMVVVDEGYALKASPQGRQLLFDIAKNGRKENAGLAFITHLPGEIPPEVSDTFGVRFLFRVSREHAAECLRWIHMEPSAANVDLIDEAMGRAAGECLFLDRWGRHGLIRVRQPTSAAKRAAYSTSVSNLQVVPPSEEVKATERRRQPRPVPTVLGSEDHAAGAPVTNGSGSAPPRTRPRVTR